MREHNLNLNEVEVDEIESIELIGEEETLDITVEDTHMFFANDIYTHNSSISAEYVEADQMGGSIKKAQIGHFILSVAKSLEQKENKTANVAVLKSRFGDDGITFEDVIFDNSTVTIDLSESGGKTFLQAKKHKTVESQNKLNDMLKRLDEDKKTT